MKEWAWKFAFWIILFVLFPALGLWLDVHLGLAKLNFTWILGVPLLISLLLLSSASGRALKQRGHTVRRGFSAPDLLVRDGIFSCMRHPNQFSMSLIPLALALILGSPCAIIVSGWALALGLIFILSIEETDVHKRFCPEYCSYASDVPAISINPKCLVRAIKEFKSSSRPRKV